MSCEDIVYDDGSHAIILNSRYQNGNAPAPILEFLDYVRTNDDQLQPSSKLVQRTKQAVHTVRSDRTKEVSYMTWAMKTRDLLRQGREEGRKEMREAGIKALVITLKELSYAPDLVIQKVAEQFGLSAAEVFPAEVSTIWEVPRQEFSCLGLSLSCWMSLTTLPIS